MAVQRVCDRSGRTIPHARAFVRDGDTGAALPDLEVRCPWLPELDGARFDDLCDDDRLQVAKYLMTIFRQSGKEDNARILSSALSTSGAPLRSLEDGALPLRAPPPRSHPPESAPPIDPPASSTADTGPGRPPVPSTGAGTLPPEPEPRAVPEFLPDIATSAEPRPSADQEKPFVLQRGELPTDAKDGDIAEGEGGWYYWLDGQWTGPRKSESFARRAYEAIVEDRAAAAEMSQKHKRGTRS